MVVRNRIKEWFEWHNLSKTGSFILDRSYIKVDL